ncbi:MAG: serine/threonine protein kinase [bacterium]|nr:serine/threonine protein kinase [bacterium]
MIPLAERLRERKLIARGDISSAYRARDARLDRDVFLKVLHPQFAEDQDLRARFEREARAAARLDHPQLVRIHEVGEDPVEGPYMLLEWVEGETLRSKIKRDKSLSPEMLRRLADSLLSALATLHDAGILHRDVKPENILLRNDGQFKLTDFSLALLSDAPKLTHHSAVVGTPAYLAPELARGKAPSVQSDLFAIGVVLFESATGVNPFLADSLLESLRRVREVEPEWSLLQGIADEPLLELIKTCLAKETEARVSDAHSALALVRDGVAPVLSVPRTPSNKKWVWPVAALFGLVLTILLWPRTDQTATDPITDRQAAEDSLVLTERPSSIPDNHKMIPAETPSSPVMPVTKTVEKQLRDTSRKTTEIAPPSVTALPDSFELFLNTTPWARVTLAGVELGTTPLGAALRLPAGRHVFMFRNPAYPPIQTTVELSENSRVEFALSDFVEYLSISVEPWGEIYLDNELIGTSPLKRLPAVLPGEHRLRITHPNLPTLEKTWLAAAGDTLTMHANLQTSELAVRAAGGGN